MLEAETGAREREGGKNKRLEEEEKRAEKRRQRKEELVKPREGWASVKHVRYRFGRLASKTFTCEVCSVRARAKSELEGVACYGCDRGDVYKVGGLFHMF